MPKSALLIKMIDLIRNKPGITISELANSTGRSERTVYRWLSELTVDIQTPAQFKDGGYYIADSPDPIAVDLTPEELLALKISLKSSPFGDGSPIKTNADSAWKKIRDAAPWERLSAARDLAANHSVGVTVTGADANPDIIEAIEDALNTHNRLRVLYRSQKSNEIKEYLVDPYAVVFRRHSWYLLAFSQEHSKVIQMKLARFKGVSKTNTSFQVPEDFSVEEHFRFSWEAWSGGEPTRVRVRFSPRVAKMISETKRHPTQIIHQEPSGSVVFEADVAGIEEIAIWIMGYGKHAEALEPQSLRDYIVEHILGSAENYSVKNICSPISH